MEMAVTNSATKSPEVESDRPAAEVLPIKALPFSNGALKRQNHHHRYHLSSAANSSVVSYKECLKNHAATLGAHALDGCGEFMPSSSATSSDPTSLKCAACGCHRNFHRREPDDSFPALATHVIEYQPHHRHHPPQPISRSPNSASPPPISSSFYPSAPHMLLALSAGLSAPPESAPAANRCSNGRKRFRTRFTPDQKEKMHQFAERMGWRMQKRDEEVVQEFCDEIRIDKGVLKVWMHNNKNSSSKKDVNGGTTIPELQNSNLGGHINLYDDHERVHAAINASSSSS